MSHTVVQKYVACMDTLDHAHEKPKEQQEKRFENQVLHNRDELLYIDLCQAMNAGDIGHGKHKYATQILRFLTNLQYNYPGELRHIIRMNLLCNPMGKSLSFRPVDWLVERNNLYTKSPLIEVYRNCHVTIENAFHLIHRTIRHAQPDMMKTIQRLASHIKEKHSHTFKPGRSALCSILGQVAVSMSLMQERKVSTTDEAEMDNIDPEDLID
ncbi:hypothetical protein F4604DRAFT_1883342 [Suillus subluteus]|nr:hypothetical protein F4604DRAFT_1883342 [Suillus subluteus]